MRLGFLELIIILGIILLIFGPKQLPKLTGAINESVNSFKSNLKEKTEITEKNEEKEES